MAETDEHPVSAVRRHCLMYLYGSAASRSPLLDEVQDDFFSFAGLHLMCTMFITTDTRGGRQGFLHKALDSIGHGALLADIDRVIDSPIPRRFASSCAPSATRSPHMAR